MRSVNGASASASEPRNISPSPWPTASGAPCRAPINRIVFALEQIDEREGAAHARQRGVHGLGRGLVPLQFVGDEEGGDLGIGLGGEAMALGGELLAQRAEILDDPVMNHRKPVAGVRVGVVLGRLAVRRPARVADADVARERRVVELGLEIRSLPSARTRCSTPFSSVATPAES